MNILSIDLGTKTGWAFIDDTGCITSGTISFKPKKSENKDARFSYFQEWLDERVIIGKPDIVYFEKVCGHLGRYAARCYAGFEIQLTSWCARRRIFPCNGVHVGTIKKFITGRGNADKETVIAAVKLLGHSPQDDNEADALALLHFAINQHTPRGTHAL